MHQGKKVHMTIRPAPVDSGITFIRTDLIGEPEVKASFENVVHTNRATTLGTEDGVTVSMVEHLLSALSGLGIDNSIIELNAPELPVMDGSSAPFVYLLKTAGLKVQNRPKKYFHIKKPVSVYDEDKYVTVNPASTFSITCSIDFEHPMLKNQSYQVCLSNNNFENEISRARTFGFLHEVEYLQKKGFARGGSLDNAVVIDRFQVLNKEGLRFEDEFVRHKILDIVGDMSLIGAPMIGEIIAHKTGHTLNNALINKIMADPDSWELLEAGSSRAHLPASTSPEQRINV